MSSRRKLSLHRVRRTVSSAAEDSVEMSVSAEAALDRCSGPQKSRSSLNDVEEQQSEGIDSGAFVHPDSSAREDTLKPLMENRAILDKAQKVDEPVLKEEIRAVSVNGTIIIPEPTYHVTPLLKRPPNLSSSPTVAVPLHSSEYNPTLDSNPTLITCFNRFPYPTHAELSWLTASSKLPEEQIKVWFTTQRLKQGITWSPEEVEEARKKMFNGRIAPAHQACAVSPVSEPLEYGQASSAALQALGQTLSSISTANISPTTGLAGSVHQTLKRCLGTPLLALEVKRPALPPNGDPRENLRMPPPLAAPPGVSASNPVSLMDMKRLLAARLVTHKGKLPLVQSKERIPTSPSSELPKERLPLSPIVSTNLKRSLIHQQLNSHASVSSVDPENNFSCFGNSFPMFSASAVAPQVNRPTIIQSASAVPLSPLLTSTEPSQLPGVSGQNDKEVSHADGKHQPFEQTEISQSDSENSCVEFERSIPSQFPLLERVKDKSPGQMKLLEESFTRNSFPSYNEVEHLMITTRLSRLEIESWFLERRALRDDLEQALLNSMGSKCESQQPLLNGATGRSGSVPFSPVQDSKSFLKSVQSSWPSPVELRHLEVQTRFARTELVRWFRDHRSAPLDRKELFGQHNGCRPADTTKHLSAKERPLREENNKPSGREIENWFKETRTRGAVGAEGRDGDWTARETLSDSD